MLKKPLKLEDVGIEKWLDDTADNHNQLGFIAFVGMVGDDPDKPKVDKANLARAFGVNRTTIYRWLNVYKEELKRGQ